jgi:hypothetical protein
MDSAFHCTQALLIPAKVRLGLTHSADLFG